MFFKIAINLSDKKFRELELENLFENLSFNKVKKNWNIEIFTQDLIGDKFFISKLLGIKEVKVEKLKIKSLASYTKDSDFSVIRKKFHISTFKKKTIKKNILIPASTAFGTDMVVMVKIYQFLQITGELIYPIQFSFVLMLLRNV